MKLFYSLLRMNKISKKYSNGFSWLVVMVTFIVTNQDTLKY